MKLKILHLFTIVLLVSSIASKAQISSYTNITDEASNSNFFLDASMLEGLASAYQGRLLGFPRTNLTKFKFDPDMKDNGSSSPNYFDGVIVYNNTLGTTLSGQGKQIPVSPGFYYFSNTKASAIASGQWRKLGGADYSANESITSNTIDDKPVYSIKGSFTLPANNTGTEIPLANFPSGITAVYKITIYNPTTNYYTNSVYNIDVSKGMIVTGSPNISVVYPEGTYYYILEYLK